MGLPIIRPAKDGTGARWEPVLDHSGRWLGKVVSGLGKRFTVGLMMMNGTMLVSIIGDPTKQGHPRHSGAMLVTGEMSKYEWRVALRWETDQCWLSDFVNAQMAIAAPEYGSYLAKYCR